MTELKVLESIKRVIPLPFFFLAFLLKRFKNIYVRSENVSGAIRENHENLENNLKASIWGEI